MKHAISLILLGALSVTVAAAQQPQYQSVAPKKKQQKPLDPADVEKLTGRPVPPSVAALPKPPEPGATDENGEPITSKRPPLNPDDVDVLTGRNDADSSSPRYRDSWESLWWLEWVERGGYVRGDRGSTFLSDGLGRDGRFLRNRSGRHLFHRQHFRNNSLFFLFRH